MMTYHRTWFSGVLWFLYTILCVALLVVCGEIWIRNLNDLAGNRLMISGVLIIPAAAALYWIIRTISFEIRKKRVWTKRTVAVLECVSFLLIISGGVIIRIICMSYDVLNIDFFRIIGEEGMVYFNMAAVTANELVTPMDYGISYLYVRLLSVVLSFLGNRVASAVFFQVYLQIIGWILAYAVTRKMAGKLPACIALLYLAGSLSCLSMIVCFGPEWLFFDCYMIGMLMTVSFVKAYCENRMHKPMAMVGAIATGALIGGLTYLDLTAASLLVIVFAVALGKKTSREEMPVYHSGSFSAAIILTTFVVCVMVWFGVMGTVSYVSGSSLVGDTLKRLTVCYENSFPFSNADPYVRDIYLIGILIVPASFLVYEYFREGKEQNYLIWILLCLLAAPTPMAVYGEHRFGVLSLYTWTVLAGLGLQNCLFGGKTEVMQAVIENINSVAEKTEKSSSRYIENPLPLPKKHVKRDMDYQYDVEEKDMKYDVDVSEDDDFEVQ